MTIGIEATKAFEREKTGVGWYTYYIVREMTQLLRSTNKLRLYVNPASTPQSKKTRLPRLPKGINTDNTPTTIKPLSWPLKYFWTQGRLSFEMFKNLPDVLFIPAHLPPLVHPKKLVVTIHDLAFKQYKQAYSPRELLLQEWGLRWVLKKAWRIIVPSQFTRQEIHRYYPRHKKDNIFVVPHGVDHQMFKPIEKKETAPSTTILYIGRLEHKKNVAHLVKAFNLIKKKSVLRDRDYTLKLIGSPGLGYDKIKHEIDHSPYKNDIIRSGWLDRKIVAEELRRAALFVFPSLYEGFGMPLLEACSSGIPIVCSAIAPLKEVGRDIPIYFNPHDPNDSAEKIATYLQNQSLQKQKIAQGITHARAFSWERAAEKTLRILRG